MTVKATVTSVYFMRRSATDVVNYSAQTVNTGEHFRGRLTIKHGVYNVGDKIDVYYLPTNPKRNTVKGAWESPAMVVFGIIIALFVLFAAWKIWEMVNSGEM